MENITSRCQQVEMLRRRVAHQFARNGVSVILHVPVYRDDSMGGRILTEEKKVCVRGVIVKANTSKSEMIANDAGRRGANEYTLTIPFDKCLCIEYNTLIECGNKQYKVLTVDNPSELDVVYQIRLANTPRHMEGYDYHGKPHKD